MLTLVDRVRTFADGVAKCFDPRSYRGLKLLLSVFVGASSLLTVSAHAAQVADAETVLIRNVRLIDGADNAADVVVSLLVKKGLLDLVTKDDVSAAEAELVVDAQNGVLIGKLDLGQPPSFLILDEDPRESDEALLDTATHARFAIRRGEIVKNDLPEVVPRERRRRGAGLARLYTSSAGLAHVLPGHNQVESLGHQICVRNLCVRSRFGPAALVGAG